MPFSRTQDYWTPRPDLETSALDPKSKNHEHYATLTDTLTIQDKLKKLNIFLNYYSRILNLHSIGKLVMWGGWFLNFLDRWIIWDFYAISVGIPWMLLLQWGFFLEHTTSLEVMQQGLCMEFVLNPPPPPHPTCTFQSHSSFLNFSTCLHPSFLFIPPACLFSFL